MTRDNKALLTLLRAAAEAAADVIRSHESRRGALDWKEKGPADFVTEVDVAAELAAIEMLLKAEPNAAILAEESSSKSSTPHPLSAPLQFIIDPLDGTTNFLHGFPDYAVSIGASVDGVLVAGVVLNVPRNECFKGVKDGGAWLGDQRLRVSTNGDPKRALIGTGFPFRDAAQIPMYFQQMARVMVGTSGIRRAGAAAIDFAHVAAGRLDGFWENSLSPWDVAAGILLVREAGGVCTDLEGADSAPAFGAYCAGNPEIHSWLLGQVRVS